MKASLIIGGLLASGAAVAGLVYSGAPEATESSGSKNILATTKVVSEQSIKQALESAATMQLASPQAVFDTSAKSAEELKAHMDKLGANWATQGVAKLVKSDASGDCPGQSSDSPGQTLHIRYVLEYPENNFGDSLIPYTDVPIPLPSGADQMIYQSPMIKEVIVRDDFEWERIHQSKWWSGADQEWVAEMRAEQQRLDELFMVAQDTNPQQAMALARRIAQIEMAIRKAPINSVNQTVNDVVEVTAPSPAWSFKYDNHTKKGDPMSKRPAKTDYSQHVAEIEANLDGIITALDPLVQFGESITSGGTREILGHTCEVIKSDDWDAETCIAQIDGQEITLWKRMDRAESTAVYLDTEPCVSLAQFMPPVDVEFAENW